MAVKNPTRPEIKYGAHIQDCVFTAQASSISDAAAQAIEALARASQAHAQALSDLAGALKGSPGTLGTGIQLSNINTPK